MSDEDKSTDMIAQAVDELQLQAWLARAELRKPSAFAGERKQVDMLARLRDELRVQAHLGKLEARDRFDEVEGEWRKLKHAVDEGVDDLEEGVKGILGRIRSAYGELGVVDDDQDG